MRLCPSGFSTCSMNYKFSILTAEDIMYSWPCVSPVLLVGYQFSDLGNFHSRIRLSVLRKRCLRPSTQQIGPLTGCTCLSVLWQSLYCAIWCLVPEKLCFINLSFIFSCFRCYSQLRSSYFTLENILDPS